MEVFLRSNEQLMRERTMGNKEFERKVSENLTASVARAMPWRWAKHFDKNSTSCLNFLKFSTLLNSKIFFMKTWNAL